MVARQRYTLDAQVSSDNPKAIRAVLGRLFGESSVAAGPATSEFRVHAVMEGTSARDLNRTVLSELRRVEKRTRLRAEWTAGGVTERYFDYVLKGQRRG